MMMRHITYIQRFQLLVNSQRETVAKLIPFNVTYIATKTKPFTKTDSIYASRTDTKYLYTDTDYNTINTAT